MISSLPSKENRKQLLALVRTELKVPSSQDRKENFLHACVNKALEAKDCSIAIEAAEVIDPTIQMPNDPFVCVQNIIHSFPKDLQEDLSSRLIDLAILQSKFTSAIRLAITEPNTNKRNARLNGVITKALSEKDFFAAGEGVAERAFKQHRIPLFKQVAEEALKAGDLPAAIKNVKNMLIEINEHDPEAPIPKEVDNLLLRITKKALADKQDSRGLAFHAAMTMSPEKASVFFGDIAEQALENKNFFISLEAAKLIPNVNERDEFLFSIAEKALANNKFLDAAHAAGEISLRNTPSSFSTDEDTDSEASSSASPPTIDKIFSSRNDLLSEIIDRSLKYNDVSAANYAKRKLNTN